MNIPGVHVEILRVTAKPFAEQVQFLSIGERSELARISHLISQQIFVAGRLAAKQLLASVFPSKVPSDINIRTRNSMRQGINPLVEVDGELWDGSLSISHTSQWAAAAIIGNSGQRVGIDVACVELRPASFARAWFSAVEHDVLQLGDSTNVAMSWAAKEAAYKALNQGEHFCPQDMLVRQVHASSKTILNVSWGAAHCRVHILRHGDHVVAVANTSQFTLATKSA